MSDVSHQNPNFHLSKPPHKQGLLKNNHKPTKKSTKPKLKNNKMMNNNNNTSCFSPTTKNKPLKVVHISNPMKYQVAAAEFRALVQGLTGRDAVVDWQDEHFHGVDHQASAHVVVGVGGGSGGGGASDNVIGDDQHQVVQLHQDLHHHQETTSVTLSACFETSDLIDDDYIESFYNHVVDDDDMEIFRAYIVNDHHL